MTGFEVSMNVINILSVSLEVLLYGIYCTLFVGSVYITLKKQQTRTAPANAFFILTIVLFIVASSHIAINLYRLLRGYVWLIEDPGPVVYFSDLHRWENIVVSGLLGAMILTGDIVLIYRCFIVWDNNYYIIILPTLLSITVMALQIVLLHLFPKIRPGTLLSPSLVGLISAIYSISLAQHIISTSLIAYRIRRQEQESVKAGLRNDNAKSSLRPIIRIIVESAVICTLAATLVLISYELGSNLQFVFLESIVPIIGIAYTLISVRLAVHNSEMLASTTGPGQTLSTFTIAHTLMTRNGVPETSEADVTMGSRPPMERIFDDFGSGDGEVDKYSGQ